MSVRSKIVDYLKTHKVSVRAFAGGDEKLRAKINRQLYHDAELSSSTVELFLAKFPDISSEWLLRNEGGMYNIVLPDEKYYKLTIEVSREKYEKVLLDAGLDALV